MKNNQHADIDWAENGVPISARFDDPYFSFHDGLEETRHVFLHGNRLPERFAPGFCVGELGFGTGLNMLATWAEWRRQGRSGQLKFVSFEAYPMSAAEMARALQPFADLAALAGPLLQAWQSGRRWFETSEILVEVHIGDARQALPQWRGAADAWFLDGFSPAKNPQLWADDLMAEVAAHTRPQGSFATYTAAGHVRRALQQAGFDVTRVPGYGRKRHMTIGQLP